MQGRVTKVLNMKPQEILGMLEETAGTRIYDERQEKARQTIEKKEQKVAEITESLNDSIIPKLNKLREERQSYMEFQVRESECAVYEKLLISHDHVHTTHKIEQLEIDVRQKVSRIEQMKQSMDDRREELEAAQKEADILKADLKKNSQNKALLEAEKQASELTEEAEAIQTRMDLVVKSEKEIQDRISKAGKTDSKKLEGQLAQLVSDLEALKGKQHEKKVELAELEDLLKGIQLGLAGTDNYSRLINTEKTKVLKLANDKKKADAEFGSLEDERHKIQKKETEFQSAMEKLDLEIGQKEKQLADVKTRLGSTDGVSKATVERQITTLKEELRHLPSIPDFVYSDPTPGFNRASVYGPAAQCFQLKESMLEWAKALEICAGGRLYNVVVESDAIASQLLAKGNLRRRETFLPLNKIQGRVLSAEVLGRVKTASNGRAGVALDFVTYESRLEPAMRYLFGSTVLCETKEIAAQLAYDRSLSLRCITKDGDVYDPAGTLTGGSSAKGDRSVLAAVLKRRQLAQLEAQLRGGTGADALMQEMDLLEHGLGILRSKKDSSAAAKGLARLSVMQPEIAALKQTSSNLEAQLVEAQSRLATFEKDASELSTDSDRKVPDIQKNIDALKKELPKLGKQVEAATAELLRVQKLVGSGEKLRSSLAEWEHELASSRTEKQTLERDLLQTKSKLRVAAEELQIQQERFAAANASLKRLEETVVSLSDAVDKIQRQGRAFESDLEKARDSLTNLCLSRDEMVKRHPWLRTEAPSKAGTNMETVRMKLKQLKDYLQTHRRLVNHQVLDMLETVEKKEAHLLNSLAIVKADKTKIEETIERLNLYKHEALEKTHVQVNKDFGEIFALLYPKSAATLVPLTTLRDAKAGLEIRVQLNGIWKKSLAELSGGQRSLVALSLILALLSTKPAPMYILDEVDAALDLSHTQHIGSCLKHKFKGSQFIIVSLKDGLFSNANVLFKTCFVDGISTIDRISSKDHKAESKKSEQKKENMQNRRIKA